MSIIDNIHIILNELTLVLDKIEENSVNRLLKDILSAKTIVTCGAGRMGLTARAFSMRLRQLGLDSYTIGDSAVPHVAKKDLLIVCSGSGETETMVTLAKIAQKNGSKIALVTSNYISRISKISNTIVIVPAQSKLKNQGVESRQPMTTLMEQSTFLFFDALVLELMKKLKKDDKKLWENHSNLE